LSLQLCLSASLSASSSVCLSVCISYLNDCVGDVYSFGILLQQIFIRSMPFRATRHRKNDGESFKALEIIMEVKKGVTPPMRPRVAVSAVDLELYQLMESCWEESPLNRPTFSRVRLLLRAIVGRSGDNIIDHLVQSLDRQTRDMELKVDLQTKLYLDEKNRSNYLLGQLLPK
jgi:Protein tyrosine and serine/threonine kinase